MDDLNKMRHQAKIIGGEERAKVCMREINNTLNKFGCIMTPLVTIRGDGAIFPQIEIVARPPVDKVIKKG